MAWAQTYPARPVRIIVGYPSGGSNDILARLMAQWLSERIGQQFVIENRPGAGSNIATEAVVRADPDGYTLPGQPANMINAGLYNKLNYNFIRDIAPVAGVMRVPLVMEVNLSIPAKTVPEFIAYAKANPGKINFASGGIGTSIHLSGELFKMMTGIDMQHVPYRGGRRRSRTARRPGPDDVRHHARSIGYIRAGKLRALAVTTATRSSALPDLPTVGEYVPGYEASAGTARRAPRYAGRDRRHPQPGDQCRLGRSEDQSSACRPGRHGRSPGSPADFEDVHCDEAASGPRSVEGSRASRRSDLRRRWPSNSAPSSDRRFALEHEAVEVAALAHVVVGVGLMHDAAVVPQHPVAMAPLVPVFVFFLVACRIRSSISASASLSSMPMIDSMRTGLRNNALRPFSGCVRTRGWMPGGGTCGDFPR